MEKKYGKVTEDQFRRLIAKLPEMRETIDELPKVLAQASADKVREVVDEGMYWAACYELTLAKHFALGMMILGMGKWIIETAKAEDPQEEVLKSLEDESSPGSQALDRMVEESGVTLSQAIAVLTSFQRTMLSIMLFKRSMSSLIEEVREGGEGADNALFNAVRVDRSALACPSIAVRISRAEAFGEKRFFLRLRNALKGPTQKHWQAYCDLRYSLVALRELGFDKLSDDELHHLLVKVLKVYPEGFTARKNLRKQYYESGKIKGL